MADCSNGNMLNWIDIRQNNFDYTLNIPVNAADENIFDAANHTIDYIINNYPAPHTLMLSGGVDSQVMLYLWMKSGRPFETCSVVFENNFNKHDLDTLALFANKFQIPISYYNLNILEFYQNEYFQYVEKYRCGSPHICAHMKYTTLISAGTTIFSGNFIGKVGPFMDKNNFSLYRYAKLENKPLVPFFFLETNTLAFSLRTYVDDKSENYIKNGIPVIRQDHEFSGFEKVKEYYDDHYAHLISRKDVLNNHRFQKSTRTYDVLLRNKYEKLYKADKYFVNFLQGHI